MEIYKMYTLKSIARRGMALGMAVAMFAATVVPSASVFADALNPLTERSLTLTSGSPGWSYQDASGNATYAPPNSGANGQKTGNTFAFRVSSTAAIKGMTFQYCTTSAGYCKGPGNNTVTGTSPNQTRAANGTTEIGLKHSDLEVVQGTASEVSSGTFSSKFSSTTGAPSSAANLPNRNNSEGNFIVMTKAPAGSWAPVSGYTMTTSVRQNCAEGADILTTDTNCVGVGKASGKKNYITLANAGATSINAGDYVKVIFFGTDTNYITNPGADAFFVKINTYNSEALQDTSTLVDGGVTVANVMNQSIEIQTKVLETMDFSVGTVDPYTLSSAQLNASSLAKTTHGTCDRILTGMTPLTPANILQMGDQTGENSLQTDKTYSTRSYWRLSSNSSAGATVYYSGVTLSNTVGDQIDAINSGSGNKLAPSPGSEQFGLALANGTGTDLDAPNSIGYKVNYGAENNPSKLYENGADMTAAGIASLAPPTNTGNGIHSSTTTDVGANASYHQPQLFPLIPATNYNQGAGTINNNYANGSDPVTTAFAFDTNSNLVPAPIATESDRVVDCVTGKMRYVANIAATTPAGIYTTKVNYIAAPQY